MIAYLSGLVARKDAERVILDVGGVGYELFVSGATLTRLPEVGQKAGVHTYLHVREEAMQLFGFADEDEKELFQNLISVSGIGPKLALSILSAFPPVEFRRVLINGDVKALTCVSGVGKKGAQRLVLELQGKLVSADEAATAAGLPAGLRSVFAEAREGLVGLGYTPAEAGKALEGYPESNDAPDVGDVMKYALRNLSKA